MKTKVSFLKKFRSKSVATPLMLTSLVDAFCVLLIFLIVASQNAADVQLTEGVKLPEVATAEVIQGAPTVTISGNQYMFQNQLFNFAQLKARLLSQKNLFAKQKAVVEADQSTPYSSIEPVMSVMSELEVESIQLAVSSQETL